MGIWGSGLYANDSTCDVRDTYLGFFQEGLNNQEAYEKTLEKLHEYIGDQNEPLLWYALAETQWSIGRLMPEVKEKALDWIDKNGGLELWDESKSGGVGWKKTLQALKSKLNSPLPKEKKIHKHEELIFDLWNVNDVYAYQFNKDGSKEKGVLGKYMLLQKIGSGKVYPGDELRMRVQILDKVFDDIPTLNEIDGVRILPVDFPTRINISKDAKIYENMNITTKKDPIWMSALMRMFKKSEYPAKHLTFIGNKQGPLNNMENKRELAWGDIDTWLYDYYVQWQGIDYEAVGEGLYEYIQK